MSGLVALVLWALSLYAILKGLQDWWPDEPPNPKDPKDPKDPKTRQPRNP